MDKKIQFSEILERLGQALDISETEYDAAVSSYMAIGNQLSKEGSLLYDYDPEILPQGSFLLGTMIKPVIKTDDLDIDLVCQLNSDKIYWTQYELKQKVGNQIKEHKTYKKLLDNPDGRRCWTLRYREDSKNDNRKYHMDILPCVVNSSYDKILEKALKNSKLDDLDSIAIRITDKEKDDYTTERNQENWLKSNPFGYAKWFFSRTSISTSSNIGLVYSSIQAVPKFQNEKTPLQRIIQILKRHRDIMFSREKDKEDKPISIIITTLAAKAYDKERDLTTGLQNIIEKIPRLIKEKKDSKTGKIVKWVENPVNNEENFADKWVEHPKREENFYRWLRQVQIDIFDAATKKGLHLVKDVLAKSFGEETVNNAFQNYGDSILKKRENGLLKMSSGTGIIGNQGRTSIPQHQPFGNYE